MPIGQPELLDPDNQETRCPVILVLDTSASMSGEPISVLNEGIVTFQKDILRDDQARLSVETAIVTFGNGGVKKIQDFVGMDEFEPPRLTSGGATPMGQAINLALDILEERKKVYKNNGITYYRPWVFLITDGAPTDDWRPAARRVRQEEEERRFLFFAVGVEGADMQKLQEISTQPPALLKGLDFRGLFQWLSCSMKRVSSSNTGEVISLPPMNWGQVPT